MARQADLVPRAGSGARASSKARNPDGSVPAIDIDVDYLVFTTVITNTCPNRRTSSAPLLALASITAHGRHSRASDDHHHHPCFARAAPPHAPWSKREVLHPSGCRSRGHPPAQGPTGQLRRPCSLVVRPQGVDSPNRSPVATSTAANSVEAGSRALGRSHLGPGQSSVAPEATDPDLLGGHMTTRSRTGAAHRLGREDVGSASGPASVVLRWCERRVGGLGPGLTSESADAARAVLRNDLSAGPRFLWHPPALPV